MARLEPSTQETHSNSKFIIQNSELKINPLPLLHTSKHNIKNQKQHPKSNQSNQRHKTIIAHIQNTIMHQHPNTRKHHLK